MDHANLNPKTDIIIISNIVNWSDFKPCQVANMESAIGKLKSELPKIKKEHIEMPDAEPATTLDEHPELK